MHFKDALSFFSVLYIFTYMRYRKEIQRIVQK